MIYSELIDKLRADTLYSHAQKDRLMYEAAAYLEKLEMEVMKLRIALRETGGDDSGGMGAK